MAVVGLGGAAVDDGYKVSGYDDSVLAFLFGVLGDEVLFDDFHERAVEYVRSWEGEGAGEYVRSWEGERAGCCGRL